MAAARFKMPTDWISLADETAAAARGFPSCSGTTLSEFPFILRGDVRMIGVRWKCLHRC